MDLGFESLGFLSIVDVLKESISIPKHSPKTFSLITLTLIFPLSIAILLHSLYTHPLLIQLHSDPIAADWTNLIVIQFLCLVVLFVFSLFSTAAVVFTVASLYSSKPVSFPSTIAAIPRVFKRLCATFIWVSISMSAYNFVFFSLLAILILVLDTQVALFTVTLVGLFLMFLMVHAYISSLWHLASVLSVVETVYGLTAMKKSYRLLKGKAGMGFVLVFCYLALCGVITMVFGMVVVRGKDVYGLTRRIIVGGFLFGLLVFLNLVGLLVQSVFYYVCKSYHHQGIDKSALYEQLGGYLGEYVPLKSSIQMEDLDAC